MKSSFVCALILFVSFFFFSISQACDSCKQGVLKNHTVAAASYSPENPEIQAIRFAKNGETIFPLNNKRPISEFRFASLSDIHRMGEVSASVVQACKCGKPWHTWICKSNNQLFKTKSASNVHNAKTAAQNYK